MKNKNYFIHFSMGMKFLDVGLTFCFTVDCC